MSHLGLQKVARIKAVRAECRKLGIDDDTRRAIQLRITGKASLADMHAGEVGRVLDEIKGRAKPGEWRFVFRLTEDRQRYAKKIYRLAERVGAIMTPSAPVASKAYIEGIARQMRGCEQPLEFCDAGQLHSIVQALEVYLKRHGG